MKQHRINSYLSIFTMLICSCYFYSCKSIESNTSVANEENLQTFYFKIPVTNPNIKNPEWEHVLTDIVQHYYDPNSVSGCMGYTSYSDSDSSTYAHEATHGLNSCIKNNYNNNNKTTTSSRCRITFKTEQGKPVPGCDTEHYCYYLLNGKVTCLKYPNMSRDKVAQFVPENLRNANSFSDRFSLYIASTQHGWDTPLYLIDEWVSYIHGAKESIDKLDHNKSVGDFVKLGEGAVEFLTYVTAVGMALDKYEPEYFKEEPKFMALFEFLAERIVLNQILTSKYDKIVDKETKEYFRTYQSNPNIRYWLATHCPSGCHELLHTDIR